MWSSKLVAIHLLFLKPKLECQVWGFNTYEKAD